MVSSVTFPFVRSNRIAFCFSVAVVRRPGAPPTRKREKLARQPTGPAGPFAYMARTATAFTERQYGHGFTETDRPTDKRKRNAGNQALMSLCFNWIFTRTA